MTRPRPRLAERAAALIVAARYAVVASWAAIAVAVTLWLPTIQEAQVGALGDLVPNDADAIQAELRSKELFSFPLLSRTVLVERDPRGLSPGQQLRALRRAERLNADADSGVVAGALPVTNTVGRPPFSRERSTAVVTYLFFRPEVGRSQRIAAGEGLASAAERDEGFVGVTGAVPARDAQAEQIADSLPLVELATVALVALAVGLHFRSPGAPLLVLLAVAVAYLTAVRSIAWLGERVGVSVPSEVEPVIVVLLFGIVTDYAIFFVSAFRDRLAQSEHPHAAAREGTAALLPIIATAGLTVAAASASLVVAKLGFFEAFGPGLAMAVGIGTLVSITFIPAGLAIAGERLFWPRGSRAARPAREPRRGPRGPATGRSRAVALAISHPLAVTLACAAVLLGAAAGLLRLNLGNPLIRSLPETAEPRQAYRAASAGFAPGILAPTVLVVEGEGVAARRAALRRFERLLSRQPGVAEVVGPAEQPFASPFGAVLARNGDAARFFIVLRDDPLGSVAIQRLRRIRAATPRLLDDAGLTGAGASFAGDTALSAETIDKTVDDLGRIAPAAVGAVLLILIVFLRALLAPLYLVAASVLALLAALGIATLLVGDLRGYGEMTYFVPVAAAVLLVALGSDYNVFLVGRIWTEARRRRLAEAVAVGGSEAATPIAIAGLVLAGSFAMLALVPIRAFRELAVTMVVGLLIDAFLVRTLLVPALIVLVGERSRWPGLRSARGQPA